MEGTVVIMSVRTKNTFIPKLSSFHLCPKFAPDWWVSKRLSVNFICTKVDSSCKRVPITTLFSKLHVRKA